MDGNSDAFQAFSVTDLAVFGGNDDGFVEYTTYSILSVVCLSVEITRGLVFCRKRSYYSPSIAEAGRATTMCPASTTPQFRVWQVLHRHAHV